MEQRLIKTITSLLFLLACSAVASGQSTHPTSANDPAWQVPGYTLHYRQEIAEWAGPSSWYAEWVVDLINSGFIVDAKADMLPVLGDTGFQSYQETNAAGLFIPPIYYWWMKTQHCWWYRPNP